MLPEIKKLLDLYAKANTGIADHQAARGKMTAQDITTGEKERMRDFRYALIEALQAVIDIDSLAEHDRIHAEIQNYEPDR